jgi:uracil-DNA glycosylase
MDKNMDLASLIPEDWRVHLDDAINADSFKELQGFLDPETVNEQVFPPENEIFSAMALTPFDQVRVVILGQDPYHDDNQAHGLAFSVRRGVKIPPSLRNIYKELESDLQVPAAEHGCLGKWAEQGVLLLNTVLTVRAHQANSHRKKGWEKFTDAVIRAVNAKDNPVCFVLWGGPAGKKTALIDESKHLIIAAAHPSPLSSYRGFFGSQPFSTINHFLRENNAADINWELGESAQLELLF